MFQQYLHLDFKGMNPDAAGLLAWIERLAALGYTGLVLEYEDRIPWRSWPGTFRPGYTLDTWQRVWARCDSLGLELIPLIPTLGHLGWLLRHSAYAHLREADEVSEACPCHPELRPRLLAWIDEVLELHPQARFIHLGADESFCLGSCATCRERAAAPDGKMSLYLDHVGALVRHVLQRGRQPLIWADAFWGDSRRAGELPAETILVDWQYGFLGPTELTVRDVPQTVWAASGVRSSDCYDQRYLLGPLEQRLRNVRIWRRQLEAGQLGGLIHTTWARASSHGLLYGPLEGWWPLVEAAADPARFAVHPLAPLVQSVDAAMHPRPGEQFEPGFMPELAPLLQHPDEQVRRAVAWWQLALDHAALVRQVDAWAAHASSMALVQRRFGRDAHLQAKHQSVRAKLLQRLHTTRQQAQALLEAWAYSDCAEFLESRFDPLQTRLTATVM